MTAIYAVAIVFPGELERVLDGLRGEYSKHMTYINLPHITLKYPL